MTLLAGAVFVDSMDPSRKNRVWAFDTAYLGTDEIVGGFGGHHHNNNGWNEKPRVNPYVLPLLFARKPRSPQDKDVISVLAGLVPSVL